LRSLAVIITTPPNSNLTATALNYIELALEQGVNILGVFFYQSGVLNANEYIALASD
jgi:tRNA 2-thiouridine synthesizing protein D